MASHEDFSTLAEMFDASVKRFGPRPLFGTKKNGAWTWTTYADIGLMAAAARGGLGKLGVERGDRVAVIANNRLEWAVAAYACYGLGAAYVPMYESQTDKDWLFILKDCGAKTLLVANDRIRDIILENASSLPDLQWIVTLDEAAPIERCLVDGPRTLSFQALLAWSEAHSAAPSAPTPEDIACLIYTSGTTGDPKGVRLSHGNIATNLAAVRALGIVSENDRSLSFLPWAHVFGHTAELNGLVCMGASIAICESVEKIIGNLAEVRPTILFAVPRIFNKIYNGVRGQMESKPAFIRSLFASGLAAAKKKREQGSLGFGEACKLALADKLIFTKVRKRFGGRLRLAVSGAAALSTEVAEFIDALGINVYEGYGLSETSPIVSVNYPGNRKLGSVGKPIAGVRVRIDTTVTQDPDNGEIIVYGPNVMQGYFNRPEENEKAFAPDGGFCTGDLGRIDADGYLFITGRIKEQYKLENGKYVVPGPIEDQLKLSPLIANVMIHGANHPYNVALIVPDMDALKAALYGSQPVIPGHAPETLLSDGRVRDLYAAEIARQTSGLKGYEAVKRFALIAEDFTQENGMLTPTLKLKRRNVLAKWGETIERLYG